MVLTWVSIIASLLMGTGSLLLFIDAVRRDYFRNIGDVRYQVFWSEIGELVGSSREETGHDNEEGSGGTYSAW